MGKLNFVMLPGMGQKGVIAREAFVAERTSKGGIFASRVEGLLMAIHGALQLKFLVADVARVWKLVGRISVGFVNLLTVLDHGEVRSLRLDILVLVVVLDYRTALDNLIMLGWLTKCDSILVLGGPLLCEWLLKEKQSRVDSVRSVVLVGRQRWTAVELGVRRLNLLIAERRTGKILIETFGHWFRDFKRLFDF